MQEGGAGVSSLPAKRLQGDDNMAHYRDRISESSHTWVTTLGFKKRSQRERLNQVCKMTTDEHRLMTQVHKSPGIPGELFRNAESQVPPQPIPQTLRFKDDPQVVGVWTVVWESSWPLNACVTFLCGPANASSRTLQSRECDDIRLNLVKLQTVNYFVTYKNGNFK